jgi:hypothetical protein
MALRPARQPVLARVASFRLHRPASGLNAHYTAETLAAEFRVLRTAATAGDAVTM